MILDYLNEDYRRILLELTIVFFCWLIVGVSIILDLIFGIRKSKKVGDFTHSYGFRKTIEKATFYYTLLLLFLFIDFIDPLGYYIEIFSIPIMSVFLTICLIAAEIFSIRENADKKYRRKLDEGTKQMIEFLKKNKEFLKELKEEENNLKN